MRLIANPFKTKIVIAAFIFELLVFVFVAAVVSHVNSRAKENIADMSLQFVRQSLMEGDLRTAVAMLERGADDQFTEIEYYDEAGTEILALPTMRRYLETNRFFRKFDFVIERPIFFSGKTNKSGTLVFRYSPNDLVLPLLLSYLLVIALTIPILVYLRRVFSLEEKFRIDSERLQIEKTIAARVSHDIRSPVSALKIAIQNLTGVQDEKRELIEQATTRINDIANDLLQDNRRINRDARNSEVLIGPFLLALAEEKNLLLRERDGIELITDLLDVHVVKCSVNSQELARSISNLMNNSIEAIQTNGKITLALRPNKKNVSIVISDSGSGIPSDLLERLGHEQISSGKEGSTSGSGLGVVNAKKSIVAMGGRFMIQSRLGLGTTVTITLPRV